MTTSEPSHIDPNTAPSLINRDEEHLRLLSLYHWVAMAFHGLSLVLFVLIPLFVGPSFYQGPGAPTPPPAEVLRQILLVHLFLRGTLTLMLGLNAWLLKKRQAWLTCVLLSILECSTLVLVRDPLGLLLGVSSILVLRRSSVKELFGK